MIIEELNFEEIESVSGGALPVLFVVFVKGVGAGLTLGGAILAAEDVLGIHDHF